MIETDAPYLKPRDMRPRVRSRRNEPQWLPFVLRTLAVARRQADGGSGCYHYCRGAAVF